MGKKWWYFWEERTDLIILFVMLLFVFGLWSFGVRTDTDGEENIEKQASAAYSEVYKVVSENQGVMKAVAGFYFGSDETSSEELKTFLDVLFDGQEWGGIRLVEIWQNGDKLMEEVIQNGSEELIYCQQSYEKNDRVLVVKTAISADYLISKIGKVLSVGVGLEVVLNNEAVFETEKVLLRKPLSLSRELKYGGKELVLNISTEDKPKETWTVFLGLGTILSFVIYALVFSIRFNKN